MWFPHISLFGLAAQIPFQSSNPPLESARTMSTIKEFKLRTGDDVFTPKDLVELARPGAGVANLAGDLALIPVSKYSFDTKKNSKSIFIAPLESTVSPIEIPLIKSGEAFWLSPYIVGHVTPDDGEKTSSLYAINVRFTPEGAVQSLIQEDPVLVGTFPTSTASNFRYQQQTGVLVFSDNVHEDGNLTAVRENDEAWSNRGNTALVYDETYERHWDTWAGPKKSSLFTVKVFQDPGRSWHFENKFYNVLHGTGHHAPVEPFGGTDDFDISRDHIIYTTKDPKLPEAWHTKQNVYIVDFLGNEKPRELTSGKQGAVHSPVFNHKGDKAAWLELDEDGYESDRAKIVIYDLVKDVRFTITQSWDRSPDSIAFSTEAEADFIYLTAGDHARNKVYVLPIPPTPSFHTTDPDLLPFYKTPVELTHDSAATGLQTLPYGRLIFSRSSVTGPNDVFILRDLRNLEAELTKRKYSVDVDAPLEWKGEPVQVTHFTDDALKGKELRKGESFYFDGAEGKKVQGWVYKPKGFKEGEEKKWPVLLLIHGGPQGVWDDRWSTRWNPNIFAQQGYFTVAINPTGSTTFGQAFTDAIAGDWGGKPFVDLQQGFKYVLQQYPEIDPDRAAAAGASWGGYAINWIQGHPEFGFNFKALVCHDGVFDATYNGYSTDELFFFNHEWGGRPWDDNAKKVLDKFNPTNFVHKWSTPQLVIHGSKDYRLPETDGIGAFHALRQRGVPSRLVIFPDENHWVLNHGNSLKWHYEVLRWLDLYTGKHEDDEQVEVQKLPN
ncbi:serine peptidase S9 [Heterobasidion irregulare TC 32-1]|uniref:Dipeptidyl-peptidase V n=1 Tax=Heterobasidion irregulare (strain TC 32-1) TaxID=747525 RepID=W4K774_HETIT|nr:serine peptidase S9 [Heterobasidion irregulare TC 32-1]ETW81653.1 serine peptidase S9 [Heterobasidion irregulare TC 32-1]